MASWESDPEVSGRLWLKASVMGRRAVPRLHYTLTLALQQRKSTENLNQDSPVATGLPVAQTWLSFEGLPRLA
jgi:hypothetical protein